jgi:hypothetical protein
LESGEIDHDDLLEITGELNHRVEFLRAAEREKERRERVHSGNGSPRR